MTAPSPTLLDWEQGLNSGATPGLRNLQELTAASAGLTVAALATTTGTSGQLVRLSDGDDEGALLVWTSTTNDPTPSWRWFTWPQDRYFA